MSSVERVVPVPGMSPGAFTVFSGVLSAGVPAQALHEAVRTGKVRAGDLPEMIASVWTRDDSPTTGLSGGLGGDLPCRRVLLLSSSCRPAAGREPGSPRAPGRAGHALPGKLPGTKAPHEIGRAHV